MTTTTINAACKLVHQTADSQTCLNDELRDAMRVVARAGRGLGQNEENKALKELMQHAWIHSGYEDCGFRKMTTEQRALYESLKSEWSLEAD